MSSRALESRVFKGKQIDAYNELIVIPALFSPDADTVLIFLSGNGLEFFEKTDDPWYRAITPGRNLNYTHAGKSHYTVYLPEEAASPMGCTSQYQFCNPSLSGNSCGPLASFLDAGMGSAPLFGMSAADFEKAEAYNETMPSRYQWLLTIMAGDSPASQTIPNIVNTLGPYSLVSLESIGVGLMGSLPNDQWKLEVRYWWAILLAALQAGLVETARGSVDPFLEPFKRLPYNSHTRQMCKSQVSETLCILLSTHKLT